MTNHSPAGYGHAAPVRGDRFGAGCMLAGGGVWPVWRSVMGMGGAVFSGLLFPVWSMPRAMVMVPAMV